MHTPHQQTFRTFCRLSAATGAFVFAMLSISNGGPTAVVAADDSEKPPEIIASHIRAQGFECEKPKSAVRDKKASKPDEPVWTLVCENATYRVREIPDQAAKVERID